MIPYLFFTGFSNSGKTTIIEKLLAELSQRGLKLAALKHASHGYQPDLPHKDSGRFLAAGAEKVLVTDQKNFSLHQHCAAPPQLSELLSLIQGVDLILIEGFKTEPGAKIVVRPLKNQAPRLHHSEKPEPELITPEVIAIVGDEPEAELKIPFFKREDIAGLADFILQSFNL